MKYLYANGYECPEDIMWSISMYTENFKMIQYANDNGASRNVSAINGAVLKEDLDILKYLHSNDYPWDCETMHLAVKFSNLDIIQYLHIHDCKWDENVVSHATNRGNLNILKYCIEEACRMDEKDRLTLAKRENITSEIRDYLLSVGCEYP